MTATHLPPQWRERLLGLLNAKATPENMRLLLAWQRAEGGTAVENPLNTGRALEGSTLYNSAGVRNYRSADDPRPVEGIAATGITLASKYRDTDGKLVLHYGGILTDLQAGVKVAESIVDDRKDEFETWSGNHTGSYVALLLRLLAEIP